MPDISMCKGINCPLRIRCYRHTAPQSKYQSWIGEVPYDHKLNSCDYYVPNTKEVDE